MKSAFCAAVALLIGGITTASAQTKTEPTGPRFDIASYKVTGATLLPAARIESLLQPFTGRQRDFGSVQGALRALERAYAEAGYSAVQVVLPEQELRDGSVRIDVTELKLGKLTVEGNRFFGEENIRRTLPALTEGTAPNVDAVARNLRTANESPSKSTAVLLKEGSTPGTVDAVARVSDQKAWRAALTLDTTGTPSTGTLRSAVAMQHANIFDRDQVLSGQFITSPQYPSKVTIVGLGYHIPLYRLGDSIDLAYVYSDVNSGQVSTSIGSLGISGGGNFTTFRYNLNLPRRGNWDNRFIFSAEWKEYSNDVRQPGAANSLIPDAEVHPLSVGFSGRRRTEADDLSFFLSAVRNIPGGTNGGTEAFNRPGARPGGSPNYTIYRYGASYLKLLPRDWQFRVSANGQHTTDMLIAGEQFGIGGMDSVRGFLEREIANDRGLRSGVELYTPDTGVGIEQGFRSRGVVFIDHGYVSRVRPLQGEVRSETIYSYGVGLRAFYRESVSLRLDFASVQQAGGQQSRDDTRLQGSLSVFF